MGVLLGNLEGGLEEGNVCPDQEVICKLTE